MSDITQLQKSYQDAIRVLGEACRYFDNGTGNHIWRMGHYSYIIAKNVGWTGQKLDDMAYAASMHDLGKLGVPKEILLKKGELSHAETMVVQQHSEIGFSILNQSESPLFKLAAEIALHHHERWDGSGYPNKVKGKDIPESARIVAISDVFDALTIERPYKTAWGISAAVDFITKYSGEYFDPDMVLVFLDSLSEILESKEKWLDNPVEFHYNLTI